MDTPLQAADLHHPAIDAALAGAADLLQMQAVFIGGLSDTDFAFERLRGRLGDAVEGRILPRADSFCARLLDGAPNVTTDAANDPAYHDARSRQAFGITSYVGVRLELGAHHHDATLCGIDSRHVDVDARTVDVFRDLARVVEAVLVGQSAPVIRRTATGWQIGVVEDPELIAAMTLADLADPPQLAPPPRSAEANDSDTDKLKATVRQLEHALAARVIIEQAIGVVAERHRLAPRPAFERIRRAARSRGRKVQELGREIVASTADATVPLPPELAGHR